MKLLRASRTAVARSEQARACLWPSCRPASAPASRPTWRSGTRSCLILGRQREILELLGAIAVDVAPA